MPSPPLRLLVLGAHPDDAQGHGGGLVSAYRRYGHTVKMVSVTDGRAGHHEYQSERLVEIRRKEAARSAEVIGSVYDVWEFPDGELQPTLEVRQRIIAEIREFAPDLVLTHRPCDYHPDHRAVGVAVQDASYLVTVPLCVPEVPALKTDPVVAYMPDRFTKPAPLAADVVFDLEEDLETVLDMLSCHKSQFFQWLPYLAGVLQEVPDEEAGRREWLRQWYLEFIRSRAERYRDALVSQYGPERGAEITAAEVFEISEYAGRWDDEARRRLFGFLY